MHRVRAAISPAHPLPRAEFATIRERLIKIAAPVIEHVARIRIQLPTSCPGVFFAFRCLSFCYYEFNLSSSFSS
jgi:hypothetical protein